MMKKSFCYKGSVLWNNFKNETREIENSSLGSNFNNINLIYLNIIVKRYTWIHYRYPYYDNNKCYYISFNTKNIFEYNIIIIVHNTYMPSHTLLHIIIIIVIHNVEVIILNYTPIQYHYYYTLYIHATTYASSFLYLLLNHWHNL